MRKQGERELHNSNTLPYSYPLLALIESVDLYRLVVVDSSITDRRGTDTQVRGSSRFGPALNEVTLGMLCRTM
jgi:hypothetical protein